METAKESSVSSDRLLSPHHAKKLGPAMLHHLFKWTMSLALHPKAKLMLAIVAFLESSFFPIPPDVMIVPMVLADRRKAFYIATICTIASVLGGIAGYLIGMMAFDVIGLPLIEFYGAGNDFDQFRIWYDKWGLLIVFAAGLTPLPYKVFTISSGFAALNLPIFILGSIISRGARFFAEAGLLWFFGETIRGFIENHLHLIFAALCVALVGGVMLVRCVV